MTVAKKIIIKQKSAGQRLDIFLSKKLKITRSQTQKMIEYGQILINGKLPKTHGKKIIKNDVIFIGVKTKESSKFSTKKQTAKLQRIPYKALKHFNINDIVIKANTPDYLVVDKPAGLLTHSLPNNKEVSLASILSKKYPRLKKVGENPQRPGIVHRLDRDASGLLVVAKNNKMFECLKQQFKNRAIKKEYWALIHGQITADWAKINFPLGRSKRSKRMAARPFTIKGIESEGAGKNATTEFWVEKRFINFTLLRVKIYTGRMHQIRAHLLAYNHPLVGDSIYFQKKRKHAWDDKLGQLFLYCCLLGFKDLNGHEQIFKLPLPKKLKEFLKIIK